MTTALQTIGLLVLSNFVPFAIWFMRVPIGLNFLWAGLCLLGAVFSPSAAWRLPSELLVNASGRRAAPASIGR